MKKIALSIDFDFFVREDPIWDFGHSEINPIFLQAAWATRYLHIDLEKECDIKKYADFLPSKLWENLLPKGLHLLSQVPCLIADSHLDAAYWIKNNEHDLIINLDAHHDCWPIPKGGIDCGSWLTPYTIETISVYPTWKDSNWDNPPTRKISIVKWKDFKLSELGLITKIFACRSSAWIPPHLDEDFNQLSELLFETTEVSKIKEIPIRPEIDLKAFARERSRMNREILRFTKQQSKLQEKENNDKNKSKM